MFPNLNPNVREQVSSHIGLGCWLGLKYHSGGTKNLNQGDPSSISCNATTFLTQTLTKANSLISTAFVVAITQIREWFELEGT